MIKKKLDAKVLVLAIIAAIALVSSIGVYAHSQYQRTVRHISNGISVSDLGSQSSGADDGLVTIHDYTPTEETTGSESITLDNESVNYNGADSEWSDYYVMDDGTVETIAQVQTECLEFSSWADAMEEIPFTVAYPNIDCPVQIYIWQADHIEAVYMSDNSSFSIDYSHFENSNWEYESIYNGEIIEQLEYVNSYGDVFTGSNVMIDQESHMYFSVAFDHYLIKMEFEDMETDDVYEVLEAFNLEAYKSE